MKIFNSIGHLFAWVVSKIVPAAAAVVVADQSPLATAIAGLLGSKGATVQSGIQAIAGDVLKAFGDAGEAVGAAGLNVEFDQATIAAIEALYGDLKGLFGAQPAPAVAPAAASAPPAAAGSGSAS